MVLGIGVGLLAVLRVDELRAVLGHELGHLGGGDTRFGPVVYRAKESSSGPSRSCTEGCWPGRSPATSACSCG
jgi:hypothetical protein